MAGRLCTTRLLLSECYIFNGHTRIITRDKHVMRGKPPGVARSLQQRLDELNRKDPSISYRVDIGFPATAGKSKSEDLYDRLKHAKKQRNDTELEKLARTRQLELDLAEVRKDWLSTSGPFHIRRVADYYGVYQHLFGDAYFIPRVNLRAYFPQQDDNNGEEQVLCPVYYGNVVKPREARLQPIVEYEVNDKDKDALYTLVLTNPDGHFSEENGEYVHWMVGNIPGGDVCRGDVIAPYLQPFPPRGTGYHRHVFLLYKQHDNQKKMVYDKYRIPESSASDLSKRSFSTLEFYRTRQDDLTPAGLCFFQSDWDPTLTDFYHKTLGMQEPRYEYDFPPPYVRPQSWFPLTRAFDRYMDRYRDPKQINKEYLLAKLKNDVHPFREPEPPLRFPNAQRFHGYVPSWLKEKTRKDRLGMGRINEIK